METNPQQLITTVAELDPKSPQIRPMIDELIEREDLNSIACLEFKPSQLNNLITRATRAQLFKLKEKLNFEACRHFPEVNVPLLIHDLEVSLFGPGFYTPYPQINRAQMIYELGMQSLPFTYVQKMIITMSATLEQLNLLINRGKLSLKDLNSADILYMLDRLSMRYNAPKHDVCVALVDELILRDLPPLTSSQQSSIIRHSELNQLNTLISQGKITIRGVHELDIVFILEKYHTLDSKLCRMLIDDLNLRDLPIFTIRNQQLILAYSDIHQLDCFLGQEAISVQAFIFILGCSPLPYIDELSVKELISAHHENVQRLRLDQVRDVVTSCIHKLKTLKLFLRELSLSQIEIRDDDDLALQNLQKEIIFEKLNDPAQSRIPEVVKILHLPYFNTHQELADEIVQIIKGRGELLHMFNYDVAMPSFLRTLSISYLEELNLLEEVDLNIFLCSALTAQAKPKFLSSLLEKNLEFNQKIPIMCGPIPNVVNIFFITNQENSKKPFVGNKSIFLDIIKHDVEILPNKKFIFWTNTSLSEENARSLSAIGVEVRYFPELIKGRFADVVANISTLNLPIYFGGIIDLTKAVLSWYVGGSVIDLNNWVESDFAAEQKDCSVIWPGNFFNINSSPENPFIGNALTVAVHAIEECAKQFKGLASQQQYCSPAYEGMQAMEQFKEDLFRPVAWAR